MSDRIIALPIDVFDSLEDLLRLDERFCEGPDRIESLVLYTPLRKKLTFVRGQIALCPDGHGPMVEHVCEPLAPKGPLGRFWRCEVEVIDERGDRHICGLERLAPDPKEVP